MPLSKWQIKPGFDKQNSEVGAVARYIGGDNVRFRYSLLEKIVVFVIAKELSG